MYASTLVGSALLALFEDQQGRRQAQGGARAQACS